MVVYLAVKERIDLFIYGLKQLFQREVYFKTPRKFKRKHWVFRVLYNVLNLRWCKYMYFSVIVLKTWWFTIVRQCWMKMSKIHPAFIILLYLKFLKPEITEKYSGVVSYLKISTKSWKKIDRGCPTVGSQSIEVNIYWSKLKKWISEKKLPLSFQKKITDYSYYI